jgi:hypothetical protein
MECVESLQVNYGKAEAKSDACQITLK